MIELIPGREYESPFGFRGGCTESESPDAEGGQSYARIERAMSSLNGQFEGPLGSVKGPGKSSVR